MVILVGLAIDQIAQSGLSSLSVIYYSAQLFSSTAFRKVDFSSLSFFRVPLPLLLSLYVINHPYLLVISLVSCD
ncbi:hypothetical protein CIG23_20650 [Raoultella planticola]|nr:hypothetical protein CIG23_20650 [Raoultella planticola]